MTPASEAVSTSPTCIGAAIGVGDGWRADRFGIEARDNHDLLVGELQPLDALERVGAIAQQHGVDHAEDAAAQIGDLVFGQGAGEHRGVEAELSSMTSRTIDELAGIDLSRTP